MTESSNDIKKVFFDQNVFADLAGRIQDSAEYLCKIRNSIKQGQLIIVPAVELFDELVPVSQSNEQQFQIRWRLIQELVDWSYALKPANEILKDDILSFADTGKPDTPFATEKWKDYGIVKTLAEMKEPPSDTGLLQELSPKIHQFKRCFTSLINRAGKNHHEQIIVPRNFTFLQYWQETLACSDYKKSFPQLMISDLADRLEVGDSCRERGLLNLLSFPTVLLPVGYWAYSWFNQVVKGCKEKSSVALDFRLCVLAGAVGFLVTGDKGLTDAIKKIPGHNVKPLNLDELIHGL